MKQLKCRLKHCPCKARSDLPTDGFFATQPLLEEIIKHSAAIKEGRKAEKLEIARKLKAEGMSATLIQKITGLSEADLDKL